MLSQAPPPPPRWQEVVRAPTGSPCQAAVGLTAPHPLHASQASAESSIKTHAVPPPITLFHVPAASPPPPPPPLLLSDNHRNQQTVDTVTKTTEVRPVRGLGANPK